MKNDEMLQRFREDGFVAPLDALDLETVERLKAAIDEHVAGEFDSEQYELTDPIDIRNTAGMGSRPKFEFAPTDGCKPKLHTFPFLFNLWRKDERILQVANRPLLVGYARRLLEAEQILLFEDNVVIKKPHSKYLPWHQDYSYWPLGEPSALTIWIALDEIDAKNGAMEVAPGTHRLGERLPVAFGNEQPFMVEDRPGILAVPSDPPSLGYRKVTYRLRPGQCGIHDAMVWHGSTPNTTGESRRVLVLRYVAAGTLWLGDSRIAYYDVGCPVGERLTSAHFPAVGGCA
jgi:hypothetical protein